MFWYNSKEVLSEQTPGEKITEGEDGTRYTIAVGESQSLYYYQTYQLANGAIPVWVVTVTFHGFLDMDFVMLF